MCIPLVIEVDATGRNEKTVAIDPDPRGYVVAHPEDHNIDDVG